MIVGTGTTARQVYDFVKGYDLYEIIGFAVDEKYKRSDSFCSLPVYTLKELDEVFDMREIKVFVALLWNRLNADRRDLYTRLETKGCRFANLVSPLAVVRGKLLGGNCWIHDYVVIQPEAEIGADCMLMAFALVGAYARLSAHVFMGTKSTVAGECEVGEQTFIGMNCTVFDNTKVGKKCILGACTAVKRNVADYTVIKTGALQVPPVQLDEETIESKLLFRDNVR